MNGQAAHGTNGAPNWRAFMRCIPRPNLAGWGIVGREIMAAMPAMVAVAAMLLLLPTLQFIAMIRNPESSIHYYDDLLIIWRACGYTLTGVLGVLCGAEEQEKGSEMYLRSLPIHPLKIMAQKITGSLIALAAWLGVMFVAAKVINSMVLGIEYGMNRTDLQYYLFDLAMIFCVTLCVGTLTGKLLSGTFISAGIIVFGLLPFVFMSRLDNTVNIQAYMGWTGGGIIALSLLLTAERYRRLGSVERPKRGRSRTVGIAWKDGRERRVLMVCLSLTILASVAPTNIIMETLSINAHETFIQPIMLGVFIVFTLTCMVLGQFFISRDDYDPHESPLDALPVKREQIWAIKMTRLLWQYAVLLLAAFAILTWLSKVMDLPFISGENSGYSPWGRLRYSPWDQPLGKTLIGKYWLIYMPGILLGLTLPALMFSKCVGLFLRSRILGAIATGVIYALVFGKTLAVVFMMAVNTRGEDWSLFWALGTRGVALAVALAVWHRFAYCRTAIRELAGWQRFLLLILFAIACHEFYTLFFQNWRDLIFLALGV